VEQIVTEASLARALFQVLVGRGDDLHIDRYRVARADPPNALFFDGRQELCLQIQRYRADLVEEERPAAGRFEEPAARGLGVGERTSLVSEELGLDERGRQRGAVDAHEGLVASSAVVVNALGHEPLAGSGLAVEQDGRRGAVQSAPADLLEDADEVLDGGGVAEEPGPARRRRVLLAQVPELHVAAARADGAPQGGQDRVGRHLLQVLVSSEIEGIGRRSHVGIAPAHHERGRGVELV
jgi:hypothetical protein